MTFIENNKIVLVVDYSNMLHRSVFVHRLTKQNCTYDNQSDLDSLMYKVAMDMDYVFKLFNAYKIIIALDATNVWRKTFYPDYKGNRERDNSINWKNIYKMSADLIKKYEDKGVMCAKFDNTEADDIAAMIKHSVFENFKDESVILISADADWTQLIDWKRDTNQFCAVYNPTRHIRTKRTKLSLDEEFYNYVYTATVDNEDKEVDNRSLKDKIFSKSKDMNIKTISSKSYLMKFIADNRNQMDVEKINGQNVVLSKIFCGDDGDNVPAFYEYYKNGKKARVTNKPMQKIIESLDITSVKDLIDRTNKGLLRGAMEDALSTKTNRIEIDIDFKEQLARQRKLVELNIANFPENISSHYKDVPYLITEGKTVTPHTLSPNELLPELASSKSFINKQSDVVKSVFDGLDLSAFGINS